MSIFGSGDREARKSRQAIRDAMAEVDGIKLPEIADQQLFLDQMISAGTLTPEMMQAMNLDPSAMEGISTDPRLKQQQMSALEQLGGIAETGMSAADQASFELARRGAAQENQAMQGQILQNMQARGQGGSGAELIAKLNGAQKSADSMQAAQLEQAKAQQAARMEALNQVGTMATNIQGQDFNQQSKVAEAKDMINRFNVQNSQNVSNTNVTNKNVANQANLANQQNINNQNTGISNQQQQYNKELQQRQFDNQMKKAAAKGGQYQNLSQSYSNSAANSAALEGQLIGAAIGAGATAAKGS